MKKGTAIKEDNKARQFASVQKVVINNTSSGTSLWVPEDIAETDELSVTENGVYCAYDDNVFGYSQVVVNVSESLNDRSEKDKAISKITGTNPDTGDTESYGVDEDGNLTKDVYPSGLPQAIHIVIAPTKKTYTNGETLDFSGIHVYLLDGEGHQWTSDEYPTGEIPFSELVFPVTVAEGGGGGYPSASSDIIDFSIPISSSAMVHLTGLYEEYITYNASEEGEGFSCVILIISNDDFPVGSYRTLYAKADGHTNTYTHNGKKVSWSSTYANFTIDECSPYVIYRNPDSEIINKMAWTMIYGDVSERSTQEIPVQWIRGDGKTLEDTFEISVASSSSGDSSGGSSSGGEHSGGDF